MRAYLVIPPPRRHLQYTVWVLAQLKSTIAVMEPGGEEACPQFLRPCPNASHSVEPIMIVRFTPSKKWPASSPKDPSPYPPLKLCRCKIFLHLITHAHLPNFWIRSSQRVNRPAKLQRAKRISKPREARRKFDFAYNFAGSVGRIVLI